MFLLFNDENPVFHVHVASSDDGGRIRKLRSKYFFISNSWELGEKCSLQKRLIETYTPGGARAPWRSWGDTCAQYVWTFSLCPPPDVASVTWSWSTSQQESTTSRPPPSCPNRKALSSWTSAALPLSKWPSSNDGAAPVLRKVLKEE